MILAWYTKASDKNGFIFILLPAIRIDSVVDMFLFPLHMQRWNVYMQLWNGNFGQEEKKTNMNLAWFHRKISIKMLASTGW